MTVLSDSLYLDMTSYGMLDYTSSTTVQDAYNLTSSRAADEIVNVAIYPAAGQRSDGVADQRLGRAPDDPFRSHIDLGHLGGRPTVPTRHSITTPWRC